MAEVQNTTQYLPELSHIIPESVDLIKINPNKIFVIISTSMYLNIQLPVLLYLPL